MVKKQQTPIEPEEPEDFEFDEGEESEVEEFMEIGGSPMPGITLRQILGADVSWIGNLAWSQDGRYLSSCADDATIHIWDIERGIAEIQLKKHKKRVESTVWSPNEAMLASRSQDKTIRIWSIESKKSNRASSLSMDYLINDAKNSNEILDVAWSPDGRLITYIAHNDSSIHFWDTDKRQALLKLYIKWYPAQISWSPDGNTLAVVTEGFGNSSLLLIDKIFYEVREEIHLGGKVTAFVWLTNLTFCIGFADHSVRILNLKSKKETNILEGHTGFITQISANGIYRLLTTKSADGTIMLWRTNRWLNVAKLIESNNPELGNAGLSLNPVLPRLATLGKKNKVIRIWDIDLDILFDSNPPIELVRYTTAKLVLVGDSGVGKTGLGWRMAHNEFKEHASTHGQQFWVIPELGKKREDDTECEAVLWDLAGQPDYRLVHSLYLDDVDTAMILFDPTNRQEPLAGVDFWLNQLRDKDKNLLNSILVGARIDRGISTLTDAELQAYCERNEISGGYVSTSALHGNGLPELLERLKSQILWDQMTTTVTTVTFKRIKEYVLSLKEKLRRGKVLLQPSELRKQLKKIDGKWKFSDAEMMTAVGHLENHGYVKVLHGSNGEQNILLSPDILANLASSIVLEARRNPRGLGVLEEAGLLRGEYQFPELNKISESERKILLDAAAVLFLEHNLCFREIFNQQVFLVFPSLINEKRPIDESIKTVDGETYQVRGAVENLYPSMVVLLGYTNTFVRTHQWQNQAQYELGKGEVCGFQQISYPDGSIELVLNYGEKTPEPVRLMFRGLFERFLSRRELEVARYETVTCKNCGSLLARNVVLDQINKGKKFSFCHECGKKVALPSPEPLTRLSPKEEVEINAQQAIANYRTAFEAALVRVKALLRDKGKKKKPTCFISYAWGISKNERWVLQLAKDLRNADIDVLLDRWDSPPGSNLDLYIERILSSDFVIAVGTPELRQKYDTRKADPVVAAELKLINLRVRRPTEYGETILPVLLAGDSRKSFPPQLQPLVNVDFRETEFYFRRLFDMIWRLYDLPFDHPQLEELQESMMPKKR